MPPKIKKRRIKHFDIAGHAHELTFSCYKQMQLLADDQRRGLLSHSIDRAMESKDYTLLAFVYMPEHVHLLVYPGADAAKIEALLYAIKRPFSFRVKKLLEESNSPLLNELTDGKGKFRFWQVGPGYDRNITTMDVLQKVIDYIHRNPVRRGLCDSPDEWKWSSWKRLSDPASIQAPDLPVIHDLPEL